MVKEKTVTLGSGSEGRNEKAKKSRDKSAKIFPQRAENQSAENTIGLKRYSPISIVIATFFEN